MKIDDLSLNQRIGYFLLSLLPCLLFGVVIGVALTFVLAIVGLLIGCVIILIPFCILFGRGEITWNNKILNIKSNTTTHTVEIK